MIICKSLQIKKQTAIYIFLVLLFFITSQKEVYSKPLKLDTPTEVAAYYFPAPSVVRCLNHSNIPRKFHKAFITRTIAIPGKLRIQQNISIGTDSLIGKNFIFSGNEQYDGMLLLVKIDGEKALGLGVGGRMKSPSIFGFGDILGLPSEINVNDKVDNINVKYKIFLKNVKGMIGNSNYSLELNGQDKIIKGSNVYLLSGNGKIGKDKITVNGLGNDKDYYEINEKYGNIETFTSIKVFD
ncbi:MAG: hypothetical protein A3B68_02740 [Candidatus Melainabacteria bacterium RIFCSPHIGHO2_02_FULL_34_12]|nr:MAG: hypothetical protein A3B68_02740 [Candidatus Melainabacteria bacterium RIFCSPHIGHO2_02_FULL_34_12]